MAVFIGARLGGGGGANAVDRCGGRAGLRVGGGGCLEGGGGGALLGIKGCGTGGCGIGGTMAGGRAGGLWACLTASIPPRVSMKS